MKYENNFESCLMYQNHYSFQPFVHFIEKMQGKSPGFLVKTESTDFDVRGMFLRLLSNMHT